MHTKERLSKIISSENKDYISFENGKWIYIDEGGLINLYRYGNFHALANKSEICMFHKLLELENSKSIEYDADERRIL
jgi:hypothetical protein